MGGRPFRRSMTPACKAGTAPALPRDRGLALMRAYPPTHDGGEGTSLSPSRRLEPKSDLDRRPDGLRLPAPVPRTRWKMPGPSEGTGSRARLRRSTLLAPSSRALAAPRRVWAPRRLARRVLRTRRKQRGTRTVSHPAPCRRRDRLTTRLTSRPRFRTGNAAETLSNVVQLIHRRFGTDVCSVYLLGPDRRTWSSPPRSA